MNTLSPSSSRSHHPHSTGTSTHDGDFLFQGVVSYGDSDVLGIMHHARYLEVAERGRTQCLMENGIDISLTQSLRFAIRHLRVRYGTPLSLHQSYALITLPHKASSFGINFRHLFYGYPHSKMTIDSENISQTIANTAPAVSIDIGMLLLNQALKPTTPTRDVKKILTLLAHRGQHLLGHVHRLGKLS